MARNQGTPEDFELLARVNYPKIAAAIAVAVGDVDLARDATQEAFLRAWESWSTVRTYEDPAGWVRRVARNYAIDQSRKRSTASRLIHLVSRRDRVEPAEPDFDLAAAVASLTDSQRMTLASHYFDDLSVGEIAELCGVAEGTVKWRLAAGRKALRNRKEIVQ